MIVSTFAPDALYWVYSPDGPTVEGSANGMRFQHGMISGPVSGFLAERICARGYRALAYLPGEQVLGWEFNPSDGPGWFLRVGTPSPVAALTAAPPSPAGPVARPSFPSDPDEMEWPDTLPPAWVAKIRSYDLRSGRRRGA